MLCWLCLHNSSQVNLLKTDEAGKAFNVSENKTNSITDNFFLKYYSDMELLQLSSCKFFSEKRKCIIHFLIKFSNMKVEKDNFFSLSVEVL